jgi:hypothetical protein
MFLGLYSKNVLLFRQLQKICHLDIKLQLCNNISYIFIKQMNLKVKLGIFFSKTVENNPHCYIGYTSMLDAGCWMRVASYGLRVAGLSISDF